MKHRSGKPFPEDVVLAALVTGQREPLHSQVQLKLSNDTKTKKANVREWILQYESLTTPWGFTVPNTGGAGSQQDAPQPMDVDVIKGKQGKDGKGKKGKDPKCKQGKWQWRWKAMAQVWLGSRWLEQSWLAAAWLEPGKGKRRWIREGPGGLQSLRAARHGSALPRARTKAG